MYRIVTDFVSDMPSVYMGMVFVADRGCDKTGFLNAFLITEHNY